MYRLRCARQHRGAAVGRPVGSGCAVPAAYSSAGAARGRAGRRRGAGASGRAVARRRRIRRTRPRSDGAPSGAAMACSTGSRSWSWPCSTAACPRRCCSGSGWMRRRATVRPTIRGSTRCWPRSRTRAAVELAKLECAAAGSRRRLAHDVAARSASETLPVPMPQSGRWGPSRTMELGLGYGWLSGGSMARRPGHGRGSAPRRMGGPR